MGSQKNRPVDPEIPEPSVEEIAIDPAIYTWNETAEAQEAQEAQDRFDRNQEVKDAVREAIEAADRMERSAVASVEATDRMERSAVASVEAMIQDGFFVRADVRSKNGDKVFGQVLLETDCMFNVPRILMDHYVLLADGASEGFGHSLLFIPAKSVSRIVVEQEG